MWTTHRSFDQYCISHKTISHQAAAAPGPKVRRECPMSKFTALPLFATNPGDATALCPYFILSHTHPHMPQRIITYIFIFDGGDIPSCPLWLRHWYSGGPIQRTDIKYERLKPFRYVCHSRLLRMNNVCLFARRRHITVAPLTFIVTEMSTLLGLIAVRQYIT